MLLAGVLAMGAGTAAAVAQGVGATPVQVDPVRTEPMSQTIPIIGRLVPMQNSVVAARSAGPVGRVRVQVGDAVGAGDVIAELDRSRLEAVRDRTEAALAEAEARAGTAEANATLAQQELTRLERLRGSAAFNQQLYDTRVQELAVARAARREAEARIAAAEVDRHLARIALEDATIRAPFHGVVTLRHTSEGAWLAQGDPVVTLLNDQDMEIEADVPAEFLVGLARGQLVPVELDRGQVVEAQLRAIIPDENPAARTRPVRFVLRGAPVALVLAANQPATLRIPAGPEREVVSVHKDAIVRQGLDDVVFVVENGVAQRRIVRLGLAVGARFQVLDGLNPGEQAVVRGNERLRAGQPVELLDPAPLPGTGQG